MTARVARDQQVHVLNNPHVFQKSHQDETDEEKQQASPGQEKSLTQLLPSQGQRRGQRNRQGRLQPGKGWPGQDAEQDPGQKTQEDFQQIFHSCSPRYPMAPASAASLILRLQLYRACRARRFPAATGRPMLTTDPWLLIFRLQHRHEGALGDLDGAHHLHALFAGLLFFQEFPFPRDVAAVALGGDVFPERLRWWSGR